MGSIIFNLIYAKALHELKEKFLSAGVVLRLKKSSGNPFWSAAANSGMATPDDDHSSGSEVTLESTYVDDEALCICASSLKRLDQHIDIVLKFIVEVFGRLPF